MFNLNQYMSEKCALVDAALDRYLPPETERPQVIHKAMRYSVFAGGKRLRPILCMAAAEAAGGSAESALPAAAALECLHTYTLVHDDLPAMDNDVLRRGRPTCHKVFGEANAILAGDGLLTLAFEILANAPEGNRLAWELARAAGTRGVVGGQVEDLAAEGCPADLDTVRFIHLHKTAALIRAACRMGAVAAAADAMCIEALGHYGEKVGLAFQIADDILNATSTSSELGKAAGTDAARGKMTYVALLGVEAARKEAQSLIEEAVAELSNLPGPIRPLVALAQFAAERKS